MSNQNRPFFVGYLGIPKELKNFLLMTSLLMFLGFAAGAVLAGLSQDDPGEAGFRFDYGRQTVVGNVEHKPYPVLHVTEGNERIPTGSSIMLSGQGKRGLGNRLKNLDGKQVEASGIVLKRGDLMMLQLRQGERGIKPTETAGNIPEPEPLGKWRLKGEICDGKCLAGAMQPGRGIAHKACANLCLIGDIPPVFVSTQPLDGEEFLMVGNEDGGPLPKEAYDYVGQFVEVEAQIERRGDLLVMLIDPNTIRIAK